MGLDPGAVRRSRCGPLRQQRALSLRAHAGGAGLESPRATVHHLDHVEPVPAHRRFREFRAATSIPCCRTSVSLCIRRCSILAMSASRSRFRLRSPRCSKAGSTRHGRADRRGRCWIFLTLGIAMGSYWAYYELGWGGWWFRDPVENASLMPWLAGARACCIRRW